QLLNRGRLEQRHQRELSSGDFLNLREKPHRQQRMPAQLKKILPDSDTLDPQQLLPNLAKLLFPFRPWPHVSSLRARPIRRARLDGLMDPCRIIELQRNGAALAKFADRQSRLRNHCGFGLRDRATTTGLRIESNFSGKAGWKAEQE